MTELARQQFPYPHELAAAVDELHYMDPPWRIELHDIERGQDCRGLTLLIYPDGWDSYHPERPLNTLFTFPVPAAAFNRESWEEWLWARIEDVENHERAENFKFVTKRPSKIGIETFGEYEHVRRPFKPAHADGWDPSVVRTVVSETVTNTPNAGRLVKFPCGCGHFHKGRMGEHFTIDSYLKCPEEGCGCQLGEEPG